MGHAWSRGLTGIIALLPNLPHIRGIYGQLVDFGHCSPSFWPQVPALNSNLNCFCVISFRGSKIAIETVVKVVWRRSSRSVRPVEQVHQHAERRNEIKLSKIDKDLCRLLNALFILPADHSSYNE